MIELTNKISSNKNLIVFIHGFMGSEDTWINKDGKKPLIDFLLQDEEIAANYNIGLFEYHSKLVDLIPKSRGIMNMFKGKKTPFNLSIEKLSDLLEMSLQYSCSEFENIILIGHSMGGLIAKRFVLNDIRKNSHTRVKLYISLATPHSGSLFATAGKFLVPNVQIDDLAPLSASIHAMSNEWVQCQTLPKRIYGQGSYDTIVPRESSVSFDRDNQQVIYSDDDHFSIIVPTEKNIIVYALIAELNKILKEQKIQSIENNDFFLDEGQYDEDVFVLKLLMADIHGTLVNGSKQAFFNAEFATRKLSAQGIDLSLLTPLYSKINELYVVEFGNLLNGTHKDSDALLTAIHVKILNEDKLYLSSLYQPLQGLQKFGMLHQLASQNNDIWWAKTHNIMTLHDFKNEISKRDLND